MKKLTTWLYKVRLDKIKNYLLKRGEYERTS